MFRLRQRRRVVRTRTPVLNIRSSQVPVARNRSLLDTLEVLALDEGFDPLLDHRDVGLELRGELGDGFGQEGAVGELFALSVEEIVSDDYKESCKLSGGAKRHTS